MVPSVFADTFYWRSLSPGGTAEFSRGCQPTDSVPFRPGEPRSGGGDERRALRRRYAAFSYCATPNRGFAPIPARRDYAAALLPLAISDVLSNDHHFTQEGFRILFP